MFPVTLQSDIESELVTIVRTIDGNKCKIKDLKNNSMKKYYLEFLKMSH